ncbi:SET domain-containing protein [Coniophora puteana RWD-64-598 SS2]|uniref:SET domain-containing protein n=1 Tax=Coniophora puteana (strain RWD-64-598) TaxID=741705 RepID=A0A5M3MDG6_CONPW|nr:SET domain-containing protein [Coniophora puteana RWD-64-598 SS2]EIW77268.1 SET domain-containing protein [Coniophora puteana RWD-64-598 SS2]
MSFAALKAKRQSKDKSFVSVPNPGPSASGTAAPASEVAEHPGEPQRTVDTSTKYEHQGLYSALPYALEVRSTPQCGRGLWAKQGIRAGTVLISVRPHVHVLSIPHLDTACSYCANAAPKNPLKRCTGCQRVRYCDAECQKSDWRLHKHECGALQNWAKAAPSADLAVPSDAVRCMGRALRDRQKKGPESAWVKEMDAMQSHRSSLHPSSFESHTHLAHSIVRYLGLSSPGDLTAFGITSARDLVDLTSRFTSNSFTLATPALAPIGVSVSPLIALINHSCDPNAVVVFPRSSTASTPAKLEPQMQVVAIKDIEPDTEILTSYIDTTLPQPIRQSALKETYCFTCACTLCARPQDATTIDPRSAVWCAQRCGGVASVYSAGDELVVGRCNTCGFSASMTTAESILDAINVSQEGLEKATALRDKDPEKALQLTTNLSGILTAAGALPSTHPLLALTELHLSLLTAAFSLARARSESGENGDPASAASQQKQQQELLDDTVRASSRYVSGVAAVLSPGHPVRAMALATLGKLLAVDEPSPAAEPLPAPSVPPPSPSAGTALSANQAQSSSFPPSGERRLQLACETLIRAREELLVGFGRQNEGGEVGRGVRETIARLERELGTWRRGVRDAVRDMAPGEVRAAKEAAAAASEQGAVRV